jgi:alpha-L-rhamnosidase
MILLLYTLTVGASASSASMPWQASWIAARADQPGGANPQANASRPLPIFRYQFQIGKKLAKATLQISGLGQFEARINGRNVTNAVLTPGWTDYRKRVFFDTYDVTALLQRGENAIGVLLGNGMYNVQETMDRYTKFAGSFGQPKLTLQMTLRFTDGSQQTIVSDGSWKTAPGPIMFSSTYGGEDYDARREQPGWDRPGFHPAGWSAAAVVQGPGGKLVPEDIPPVKASNRYDPIAVAHPGRGISVYDLGQNFSGWPEIALSGGRGTRVTMIAGELLDAHGFVTQRSAHAFQKDPNSFTYVLKGKGVERWHPRFSYYGFRYVQVQQQGKKPAVVDHLDGRFLHDAVQVDGSFTTSDELLQRIHTLINRAMLSNMFSVLTDCPHREKLGWLEQSHLNGPSLLYNYDLSALYRKLADDMQDAQLPSGLVPDIAPEFTVFSGSFRDSPEWGAAVILSTWTAYQFYGDKEVLRAHYDSMRAYVGYLTGRSKDHLLAYGLGDWYDLGPQPPGESQLTSTGVTATAIYYQVLTTMARVAVLAGHGQDAEEYSTEAAAVRDAFNARYFHPQTNQYDLGSQTANAMPLVLGLAPKDRRDAVLANLVADIRQHSNHVTAGDVGFHYLVRALTENDRSDVLYDVLSRTDAPSYGYQLAQGATTLTEAWDANPEDSQNHFMLGEGEEWFYRGLAGIDFDLDRDEDSRIRIHPAIVGEVQEAAASFQSNLGKIRSGWSRNGAGLRMTVSIPEGATATIVFPPAYRRSILVNGRPLQAGGAIRSVVITDGMAGCVVTGGTYTFDTAKL